MNPFIGTVLRHVKEAYVMIVLSPGASVPFGMVKFTRDFTGYAPAGYIADASQQIRGLSPLHDSGTGASTGSYGNFEIMPLLCPDGFHSCTTRLAARERFRKNDTDDAYPGYFAITMDNEIKMEATSTRRAGLERFSFPPGSKPFFVLELANDLPTSFAGGTMDFDLEAGRAPLVAFGNLREPWGPSSYRYQAFACYDLFSNGNSSQTLDEYGIWTGDGYGLDQKALGVTHLNYTNNLIGGTPYESGALFSFANADTINIRVGVSFDSASQAYANAESEVGAASFEEIVELSRALWQEKLRRVQIDVPNTSPNVTEMFYSSLYRSFLMPNNATREGQGPFANTTSPYFDSLYCTWDTAISDVLPLDGIALTRRVWSNNLLGYTQGGSDGDNVVSHFAVLYHNEAARIGVEVNELYSALKTDAEINPSEWNTQVRQVHVYKEYGYVPFAIFDPASTGQQTCDGSRTSEYAINDFDTYTNRSFSYQNVWGPGRRERRLQRLHTKTPSQRDNNANGFCESCAWEYSFFAPHDTAQLIELMGGNVTFVGRLDHFFDAGYYRAGNEPSFQTPVGHHYTNRPTKSVDRVHDVIFSNIDITPSGLPGNDDQAAMATLLIFHLLGLYPVPSTSQLLILSPFTPKYTIYNSFMNSSTTVTMHNFDAQSIQREIPSGVAAYVRNVTTNGVPTASRCHLDFYDTFRLGGEIEIMLTSEKDDVDDCAGSVPDALSAGGFAVIR
ncbi:hypothetical protein ACEPAF_7322 [Sanghuangporus sanghuang]